MKTEKLEVNKLIFGRKKENEKKEKTRKEINKISAEIAEIWNSEDKTKQYDAEGWYTGNPKGADVPVQDADDL